MGEGAIYDDEKPKHDVTISDFYLAETEVTNAQYMLFVDATQAHYPEWLVEGSKYHIATGKDNYYKKMREALNHPDHPVVGVTWEDALAYCSWLSNVTGEDYRLPTEAEWEYAASRGASPRLKWEVGDEAILRNYGNFTLSGGRDTFAYTAPVKSFKASSLGLYDMAGNVFEWCQDWYGEDSYASSPKVNPTGPDNGTERIMRGGSWSNEPSILRITYRFSWSPSEESDNVGFRVAKEL